MAAITDNLRDELEEELALCLSTVVAELREEDEDDKDEGEDDHSSASSFLIETLLENINNEEGVEGLLRTVTFTQVGAAMEEVAEVFYDALDELADKATLGIMAWVSRENVLTPHGCDGHSSHPVSRFLVLSVPRTMTELQSTLPVVPRPGDYGMAVMKESEEWHECKVVRFSADAEDVVVVAFLGFGGEHEVKRDVLRLDEEMASTKSSSSSSSSFSSSSGQCEMCQRTLKLTRHHLIPRTTHSRLRTKDPEHYTRELLNKVALVCRPCHSALHRAEDEMSLALNYSTVELLMEHPQIASFCAWMSSQKSSALRGLRRKRSAGGR